MFRVDICILLFEAHIFSSIGMWLQGWPNDWYVPLMPPYLRCPHRVWGHCTDIPMTLLYLRRPHNVLGHRRAKSRMPTYLQRPHKVCRHCRDECTTSPCLRCPKQCEGIVETNLWCLQLTKPPQNVGALNGRIHNVLYLQRSYKVWRPCRDKSMMPPYLRRPTECGGVVWTYLYDALKLPGDRVHAGAS